MSTKYRDDDIKESDFLQASSWTDSILLEEIQFEVKNVVAADLIVKLMKCNPKHRLKIKVL